MSRTHAKQRARVGIARLRSLIVGLLALVTAATNIFLHTARQYPAASSSAPR